MKIISIESHGPVGGGEMVDAIDSILLIGQAEEVSEMEQESAQLVEDMRLLSEIKNSIQEHGVTPSLESIFGDTLRSGGISLNSANVACEGLTDTIKAIARKIWRFIADIVVKVRDYFEKRFGSFQKYYKALKQKKKVADGEGSKDKRAPKIKEKGGEDTTISASCLKKEPLKKLFASATGDIIGDYKTMLEKAESGDEISDSEFSSNNGLFTIDKDTDDDGIHSYTLESNLDDLMDSDLKVVDILDSSDASGAATNYIKYLGNALPIAKALGGGKLWKALDKQYAKISNKAEKNAKNADYDDDAKVTASNVRNGLALANKIIKLDLARMSKGMSTLLAIPTSRENAGSGKKGSGKKGSGN